MNFAKKVCPKNLKFGKTQKRPRKDFLPKVWVICYLLQRTKLTRFAAMRKLSRLALRVRLLCQWGTTALTCFHYLLTSLSYCHLERPFGLKWQGNKLGRETKLA